MIDVKRTLIRLNNKFPELTGKELLDIIDCITEQDYLIFQDNVGLVNQLILQIKELKLH